MELTFIPTTGWPSLARSIARSARRWAAIVRLKQWVHFLLLPMAGYDTTLPVQVSTLALARGVAIALAVLAFGYGVNAVADRHMDLDTRKNPLSSHGAVLGHVSVALAALALLALVLAATGPLLVVTCVAFNLICGSVYSIGPRLKSARFVGTVANAGNFAPLLFVGLATPNVPERLYFLTPVFVALLLQNQLLHEAADAPEDRRGGVRSTFLVLGRAKTAVLAAACGTLVFWTSLDPITRCAPAPLAVLHAVPYVVVFPALLARGGDAPELMARTRFAQRWSSLVTGALLVVAGL